MKEKIFTNAEWFLRTYGELRVWFIDEAGIYDTEKIISLGVTTKAAVPPGKLFE